jgi:cellulose synthase/poly-beta-1,6-N-acetylglucosamine synthase-like glycosyltransferase
MTDHFNYAGNKAKGKYISFLSSDDFLEPDCINKLMEILIQNPKVAMGYCNNNMLDDSTNVSTPIRNNSFKTGIYSPKILSDRFYNYTEYWIIGGIFKREIFIENNFPDHIVAGDWVLGFKILKYGEVAYINEVLSTIRTHERIGDAKENYSALYIQHEIERMKKHDCIIEDVDLLYKIGMPKSKAEKYKYKEQIFSYITLIRKYRNGLISENMIDEIFQKINPHQYGYFAKYFAANYKSKTCYYLSFFAGQFVKYSL